MEEPKGYGPQETLELLEKEFLGPRADEIRRLCAGWTIAVVLFGELKEPMSAEMARHLGWDGKARVFPMSRRARGLMASNMPPQDAVTGPWLKARVAGVSKVFVIGDGEAGIPGTFLVNWPDGGRPSFEPGSLDAEWMA